MIVPETVPEDVQKQLNYHQYRREYAAAVAASGLIPTMQPYPIETK